MEYWLAGGEGFPDVEHDKLKPFLHRVEVSMLNVLLGWQHVLMQQKPKPLCSRSGGADVNDIFETSIDENAGDNPGVTMIYHDQETTRKMNQPAVCELAAGIHDAAPTDFSRSCDGNL